MIICGMLNNNYVVKDIYFYKETFGLPLIVILDKLKENNLICAWDHYINDALKAGGNIKTIISSIEETFNEFYDNPNGKKESIEKLHNYIKGI